LEWKLAVMGFYSSLFSSPFVHFIYAFDVCTYDAYVYVYFFRLYSRLSIAFMVGLSTFWKSSLSRRGRSRGGPCGWRSAVFGLAPLGIDLSFDVVWLDFMAPHRPLVVDVTVASARTNSYVPTMGAPLPLHGSLATGAQYGKLDGDARTSASLVTPSIQSVHVYCPFALEDGGRLALMACELINRLAILVSVRGFHGMGAADSRSLRSDIYVRMHQFVCRSTSIPFIRFLGDVRREFVHRFSVVLHGTLGSYLRDALQEGSAYVVACLHAPRG
jgi:hypothetical protein